MASHPPTNVYARDIMVTKLITLKPEVDVFQGIELLIKHRISGAPVIDDSRKLLGIFSEKSCMQVLIDAAYEQLPTNRVDAFMDKEMITITEDTQLLSVAQIFLTTPRRRLPVLDGEQLVGQVSRRDVLRATLEVIRRSPDRASTLLYLSALRAMDDVPAV